MQGLADGYFVVPYTMGNYLGRNGHELKARTVTAIPQRLKKRWQVSLRG